MWKVDFYVWEFNYPIKESSYVGILSHIFLYLEVATSYRKSQIPTCMLPTAGSLWR